METPDDAIFWLTIVDKEDGGLSASYSTSKDRDDNDEYRVEGPSDLQAVIDAVLASIKVVEPESE